MKSFLNYFVRSTGQQAEGVWLIKYEPGGANKFRLSYSLTHILFKEGWIVWSASPSVPLVVKTSGDKEIGRFWSDGRGWCDIIVDVNYHSTVHALFKPTSFLKITILLYYYCHPIDNTGSGDSRARRLRHDRPHNPRSHEECDSSPRSF